MTDTERLNELERLLWDERIGNGVAVIPSRNRKTGEKYITLIDMKDFVSIPSNADLTDTEPSLRSAIDEAVRRLECKEPFSHCLDCDDRGGCERYGEHRGNNAVRGAAEPRTLDGLVGKD